MVTSPFISIVWCFRPYKPYIFWKLIIWWWQWPRRILTKRQRHTYTDKDKYKVLPRPNVCYIYQKQGVQGFKILYWLSSCDDKNKDKDKKPSAGKGRTPSSPPQLVSAPPCLSGSWTGATPFPSQSCSLPAAATDTLPPPPARLMWKMPCWMNLAAWWEGWWW